MLGKEGGGGGKRGGGGGERDSPVDFKKKQRGKKERKDKTNKEMKEETEEPSEAERIRTEKLKPSSQTKRNERGGEGMRQTTLAF